MVKKAITYILIYYFATYLPNSDNRFLGILSKKIRGFLFKLYTGSKSENINIQRKVIFSSKVKLGKHSGIGTNSNLQGPTTIGDYVMMGPEVNIYTINHETINTNIPMCEQGLRAPKPVIIGNDVWIGSRVTILPGVSIGDGAIIGAGAIVTKNIPSYTVAGGNPARVLKSRKEYITEV